MRSLVLPPRKVQQNLHAYVREHLHHLERVLRTGVPYSALVDAVLAAGFSRVPLRSIQNAVYQARKKRSDSCSAVSQDATGLPPHVPTAGRGKGAAEGGDGGIAALRRRFEALVRGPGSGSDDSDELV